jgi:hypothetical protein
MTTLLIVILIAVCVATFFYVEWKRTQAKLDNYVINVVPAFQKELVKVKAESKHNFDKASEHFNLFLAEKKAKEAAELNHWDAVQVIKMLEQERDMLIELGYRLATEYAGFVAVEKAIKTKRLIGWIAANETPFAKWHYANPDADDAMLVAKFKELSEEQEVYPLSDTEALFNA